MTYKALCDDLTAANEWLSGLGIREQLDRLRQHIRRIERLEVARQAGKLTEASQGDEGRLATFSLTEALELLNVHKAFSAGHPNSLPSRIKDALDGPADLSDESPKSSYGRNIMFELNLASRLKSNGVPVALPINPDILTAIEKHSLHLQCKRPFGPKSTPENILAAEKQLMRDIQAAHDPDARGVIAVSVSRVFNAGDQLYAGANEATAKKQLGDEVQALGEQCRDTWSNIADPRITGILFHVITPSHIQDINLLTVAQQTVVFSLPNRAEPEVELLRRFADIIGN